MGTCQTNKWTIHAIPLCEVFSSSVRISCGSCSECVLNYACCGDRSILSKKFAFWDCSFNVMHCFEYILSVPEIKKAKALLLDRPINVNKLTKCKCE